MPPGMGPFFRPPSYGPVARVLPRRRLSKSHQESYREMRAGLDSGCCQTVHRICAALGLLRELDYPALVVQRVLPRRRISL